MHDNISGNIRKIAVVLLGLLLVLFFYVTYLQVYEGTYLASHPLNRRAAEMALRVERGRIQDRHGDNLAVSTPGNDGTYKREYPTAGLFAHIVGYDSDKYGKAGLEATFNGYLSGITNPARQLGAITHLMQAKAGYNVVTTLDAGIQREAYRALGNNRGAVVVIAPKTGELLAMVSKPSFDPNTLDADWATVSTAVDSPLLNRTVQGLYPPGSVLKVMMAEAVLKEKVTDTKKTYLCKGSLTIGPDYVLPEVNYRAHGRVDLEEALAVSCNVTFGQVALAMGRSTMAKTFDRYGFKKPVGEELEEVSSRLPAFNQLSDGDLAQTGIGQGSLLVTPLRMAMLAATIANNGIVMQPYLVSRITAPDGAVVKQFNPKEWLTVTNRELAQIVKKMMVTVVTDGTGSAARIPGVAVAGKTGTAENPHGNPHAWFIGFAPADDPKVAIAVIVENAGSGGAIAAPIARQVLTQALR